MSAKPYSIKHVSTAAALCCGLFSSASTALTIASAPLFLTSGVAPNVMLILDDSGSMQWEYMPEGITYYYTYMFEMPRGVYGGDFYGNWVPNHDDSNPDNYMLRSSAYNRMFYNPDITYQAWKKADGSSMDNASPSCALYNPVLPDVGCLNLTQMQTESPYGSPDSWPIDYYIYNGGDNTDRSSYTRVQITSSTSIAAVFTSPAGISRSRDEEIQNFANWFSYYRSRALAVRAGVGNALARQGENIRLGFAALNKDATIVDGVSTNTIISGVRPFSGSDRSNFFSVFYDRPIPALGTPSRRALGAAGEYFSRTDNLGPWGAMPGTDDSSPQLSCRQNFAILATDGYWNSSRASPAATENTDGTDGPTISGYGANADYTYKAVPPFADSQDKTLADVAMYYWKNDLRPDLVNNLMPSMVDPAFWQHMVTFGVGLGVFGAIDPAAAFAAITSGASIDWPSIALNYESARIDDLLHATVNSRGYYFSATDPASFADKLTQVFNTIVNRSTGSAASVVANTSRLNSNTGIFLTGFDSSNWTGSLYAYRLCTSDMAGNGTCKQAGDVDTSSRIWDAGKQLSSRDWSSRALFSYNSNKGVTFAFGNVATTLTADQISYLSGNRAKEADGTFRVRSGDNALLGDIVNSGPEYIGNTDQGYQSLAATEGTAYSAFRTSPGYQARTPLLAVGANDGMLHVFNAKLPGTADEVFAYVPETILNNLAQLTTPQYNHKYFVDGPIASGDAYFDADSNGVNEWRTVLVASLGAGDKGLFALDVTFLDSALNAEPTFTAKRILWEINNSKSGFAELGYILGQVSIARLANGQFAAIFGNGYDSASNRAGIYIVDIKTGALIKYFDTGVGTAANQNGMSTPLAVDINGDHIVDAVVAGDLQGNVWKLDVHDATPGTWDFAVKSGATPLPLFTATTAGGISQAITAQLEFSPHPAGGMMLYFGTGKYFETGDNAIASNPVVNSLYGIRDDCVNIAPKPAQCKTTAITNNRANLVQQTITEIVQSKDGTSVPLTTNNPVDYSRKKGWTMDLVNPPSAAGVGERVIAKALVKKLKVVFLTLTPNQDPCNSKPEGRLFVLDALTGNPPSTIVLDVNGDGIFDKNDKVNSAKNPNAGAVIGSGISLGGPVVSTSISKIGIDDNIDKVLAQDKDGNIITKNLQFETVPVGGRQSWVQLR